VDDEQPQGRPVAHLTSGHESDSLGVRGLLLSAAALIAMAAVALFMVAIVMKGFSRQEKQLQSLAAPRFAGDTGEYPSPRIQTGPTAELTKMKAEDLGLLGEYGWIDHKAGIARIPVERAIDILAKSGLPLPHADQATAGSPAAAKGSPADQRAKPGLEGKQKP
jgi:hypothetical protein